MVGLSLGGKESTDVGIVDGDIDADGNIVWRLKREKASNNL